MYRQMGLVGLVVLLGTGMVWGADPVPPKPVTPLKEWSGSVADLTLQKIVPEVITTQKDLDNLWKTWAVAEAKPEVDFAKQMVVLTTTRGGRLRLTAALDDKGNLKVSGVATRDLRSGFRYVIATVNREGIKTVNGKELAPR